MMTANMTQLLKSSRKFQKLAQKLPFGVNMIAFKLAKYIKESARKRAPVFEGQLRDSIKYRMRGRSWIIEVTAPYAKFQEYGFRPHYVSVRSSRPKLTRYAGRIGIPPDELHSIYVTRFTPFLGPAIGEAYNKLPKWLRHIEEAKRAAGFKV